MAQEYIFVESWCWLFSYFGQRYYDDVLAGRLTSTEFLRRLNSAVPQLQKLIVPEADKTMVSLRHKLAPEMETILEAAFKREN